MPRLVVLRQRISKIENSEIKEIYWIKCGIKLTVIGLVVIIVGIITGTHGATVVGIIVSGVNAQQWIQWNKKENNNNATQ